MLTAEERELAQRQAAGVTHAYLIRFSPALGALTPQDLRIAWQGRTFEVLQHLDPEGRRRRLEGLAKELAA
jgi:head-tail adaptor